MRLVNYIRSTVASGTTTPDVSDASLWLDEKYMQPTLQDDAVLFSLDDIMEFGNEEATMTAEPAADPPAGAGHKELASRAII